MHMLGMKSLQILLHILWTVVLLLRMSNRICYIYERTMDLVFHQNITIIMCELSSYTSTSVMTICVASTLKFQNIYESSYLAMYCRYLRAGRKCWQGCTRHRFVCHKFAKHGSCHRGKDCNYEHIAQGPQRDSFNDTDVNFCTEHEKACKILGLDSKCTFLSDKMVSAMYRVRALAIHPDKNSNDTSHHMMIALVNARDFLLQYIGNTHPSSSSTSP